MTTTNTATQKMSEHDLNTLNTTLKSQSWYQQFFAERGLNMNSVKLSSKQRQALTQVAAQNGYELGSRMKFDEAGNMNQSGGFAGMPTWAKIAIAAAPVVATAGLGAAGIGPMAGMMGASTSAPVAGATAASMTVPELGVGMIPTVLGAGVTPTLAGSIAGGVGGGVTATTAAATPSLMSRIASNKDLLSGAGRMVSQMGRSAATNRGVAMDAQLTQSELNLRERKARQDAETDAYRKSLYGQIAAGYQPSSRPTGIPSRNPVGGFITDDARKAGQMMTDTAMARMRTQDYGPVTSIMSNAKPGVLEQIANYAGPALSLFDPRLYDQNGKPYAR